MIFALAIKLLPSETRELYAEAWLAELAVASQGRRRNFFHNFDLLRASISIRMQQRRSKPMLLLAVFSLILALLLVYLTSWFSRDLVLGFILLIVQRRLDFRQTTARRAGFVTAVHFLLIGAVMWLFAQFTSIFQGAEGVFSINAQPARMGLACLAAGSLLAGLVAIFLWLADAWFAPARTILARTSGSFLVFAFAMYWLFELNSCLAQIGGIVMSSEVAAEISRIQQRSTNLVLPAIATLIVTFAVSDTLAKRRATRSEQTDSQR